MRCVVAFTLLAGLVNGLEGPGLAPLVWGAPIGCDFSGFFVEILAYLVGLNSLFPGKQELFVNLGVCSESFLQKLEAKESSVLKRAQNNFLLHPPKWTDTVLIQHKLPGSSFPGFFRSGLRPKVVVGRMMTEASYLPAREVKYIEDVDEVWVPSTFHSRVFAEAGVPPEKIFVLPEAVNADLFGGVRRHRGDGVFRFVSVFKYEFRKGAEILLRSFWETFKRTDPVELVIRSYKPSWEPGPSDLNIVFNNLAKQHFGVGKDALARVVWVEEELSNAAMRELYLESDAFVLPTRGEGWCLPCVEAMASALPIIVTNFSGPTMYLMKNNSYGIRSTHTNPDGTTEPDAVDLSRILRHVFENVEEARGKGRLAREFVATRFHPKRLASVIVNRLEHILSSKTRRQEEQGGEEEYQINYRGIGSRVKGDDKGLMRNNISLVKIVL